MKRKNILILIFNITLILIILLIINKTSAKYIESKSIIGQTIIAKPIINLKTEDTFVIENLTRQINSFNFSICNYDEQENLTEVGLEYVFELIPTQMDAPIKMDLYKINDDESLTKIELSNFKTVNSFIFNIEQKQEDRYKLDITYDISSNIVLKEPTEISLKVKSVQI